MNQPQLPLSHSADPATSHDAEHRHEASGRLAGNRARVLALAVRWPGCNCQEYFELCVTCESAASTVGMGAIYRAALPITRILSYALLRETIKKRMRDLFELDLVERQRDEDGKWITRNGAIVYWPTARGILVNAGETE